MGVMSDFDFIEMKFGLQVKIDVLNNIPKFGGDQLIRDLSPTRTKKLGSHFLLVNTITVAVIDQNS